MANTQFPFAPPETPSPTVPQSSTRVFTIQTPTGRTLDIEAADEANALRGAQEWEAQNPLDTSLVGGVQQGASNALSGTADTLHYYGGGGGEIEHALRNAADSIRPANYRPAQVVTNDPDSGNLKFSAGEIPHAVAEQAVPAGEAIAAARIMARVASKLPGFWPKVVGGLAGAGAYALSSLGDRAKERAEARTGDPNAEPTTADKATAAAAMIPEAALGGIGASRFLPSVGKVASVGARGVIDTAKALAKTAATEGATATGQNVIAQTGRTVGTPGGVQIDLGEAANAGIIGGATGATFGGPKALRDATTSVKFSDMGGDMAVSAAAVANRLQARVSDPSALQNSKTAYDATARVHSDVLNELAAAKANLGAGVSQEAANALDLPHKGFALTDHDLTAIKQGTANVPGGDAVRHLAAQAAVLSRLVDNGTFDSKRGRFSGGIGEATRQLVRSHPLLSIGLGGGLAFDNPAEIAHLAFNPAIAAKVLALTGAAYGTARVADRALGLTSPARAFVDRFADPTVPVRPAAPPRAQQRPTGPTVSGLSPWEAYARAQRPNASLEDEIAAVVKRGITAGKDRQSALIAASARPPLNVYASRSSSPYMR